MFVDPTAEGGTRENYLGLVSEKMQQRFPSAIKHTMMGVVRAGGKEKRGKRNEDRE